MSEAGSLYGEYVPQKVLDLQIQNIRDKVTYEKEITDERLDKFQAVLERNFAELKTEMRIGFQELRGEIERLDERIDGVDKRIDGVDKRIDDLHQSHNKWFAILGILISVTTVVAPIAVAVVQHYLSR